MGNLIIDSEYIIYIAKYNMHIDMITYILGRDALLL